MPIPLLFELNQELTRLFVAGSRLSIDDPRLKKYLAPLKKFGEKAPVFTRIAEHIEELLQVDPAQSALKLIETETFLLSVLSTQGETAPSKDEPQENIAYNLRAEKLGETHVGYRTLSPVITALTTTGSGRMDVVRQAYEKGVFKDPRLLKMAVGALGDRFGELADFMAETVLPSMGKAVCPFLLDGYNVKGGVVDGRRLAVLHRIEGADMLQLVDEAVEKANAPVKIEAVKIMAHYPRYEALLLDMMDESKSVREEVAKALGKMKTIYG